MTYQFNYTGKYSQCLEQSYRNQNVIRIRKEKVRLTPKIVIVGAEDAESKASSKVT
jgi:hypothetical protein